MFRQQNEGVVLLREHQIQKAVLDFDTVVGEKVEGEGGV